MKTLQRFALTLAVAVLFAAPKPAAAQQEDVGILMQQLSGATGCNVCVQSCVVTQAVEMFDYNIPAMMAWFGGLSGSYSVWMELFDDDLWFFADWPLFSNDPVPIAARPIYLPELPSPLARLPVVNRN